MTLYTEPIADQTDNFADVLFAKTLRTVMTFERTQPTPFCLEKSSVKNGQFNVIAAFSVQIELE